MSVHKGIVTILNFIRGYEPRDPNIDLLEPVVNQMRLAKEYNLPTTWLLQYEVMQNDSFMTVLKEGMALGHEYGIWFEFSRPLFEKAGIPWKGRFNWDWHSHIGFSIGYTPQERTKIVDTFMGRFKEVFGNYPKSVGSWFIDAFTLQYMADRYGIVASCNCKDQWGTDGYSLWGGYYNQAYYPSKLNSFMPAQNPENQIPVPVFRMLGSDPIYQYNAGDVEGCDGTWQGVVTLEPVYKDGGGNPDWVRWFFDTNFTSPALSFGYAQVGQENPFGWPAMEKGLTFQMKHIAERLARGEIRVMTLGQAGTWFKDTYPVTPASAITALTDYRNQGNNSVWYNSRFYRVNLFWDHHGFYIRDLHLFNERYPERYLTETCPNSRCIFDTLPIFESYLWSKPGHPARMGLVEIGENNSHRSLAVTNPQVIEQDDNLIIELVCGDQPLKIICKPDVLEIQMNCINPWGIEMSWPERDSIPVTKSASNKLHYLYNGFSYQLISEHGKFSESSNGNIMIMPEGDRISFNLSC
jgi:hypothetical protein